MIEKNIILGITGSISAYKSPNLLREFVKNGYTVNPIMTHSAEKFVSSLVLSNLSRNKTIIDGFENELSDKGAWHVKLAYDTEMMIIAPCSANTLSKLALGIVDNALLTVAFSLPKTTPLIIAPAMDTDMWESKQIQNNIKLLKSFGYYIIEPEYGELSSGLTGKGRLPEITTIFNFCENLLNEKKNSSEIAKRLKGKKILITAGPTIEKIDEVRFLSNFSSGKMGFALAEIAQNNGAEVCLISGKVNITPPLVSNFIQITNAEEMFDEVKNNQDKSDIMIFTAAVADFKPESTFKGKLKKENLGDNPTIKLIKTIDILKAAAERKSENQIIIGFALENENEEFNALKKLKEKNCDFLVLNSINDSNSPFGNDENNITIFNKRGSKIFTGTNSKKELAKIILDLVC